LRKDKNELEPAEEEDSSDDEPLVATYFANIDKRLSDLQSRVAGTEAPARKARVDP